MEEASQPVVEFLQQADYIYKHRSHGQMNLDDDDGKEQRVCWPMRQLLSTEGTEMR